MNSTSTRGDRKIVREIVERVAENVEGDALNIAPLGTVIDPQLLVTFVGADAVGAEVSLRFEYERCGVTVYGDGRVSITETPARPKEGVG